MATTEITEFEQFANDLAVYATTWVQRCQNKIIEHAHELFDDAAIRKMVHTYAVQKAYAQNAQQYEFVKACIGEDITEVDGEDIHSHRAKVYKEVLDDLIFDTYCRD